MKNLLLLLALMMAVAGGVMFSQALIHSVQDLTEYYPTVRCLK
jgi:hypothetical protein